MPIPKTPTPIAAASFEMAANPDAIAGVQANETFMLTGMDGGALGKGGERIGFAKYQFDGQKHQETSASTQRLPGVIEGIRQSSEKLTIALAQDAEGNGAEVQTAMGAAVTALKEGLPANERDGVDAMNPQQVLAAMETALPGLKQKLVQDTVAFAALDKVYGAAAELFDPEVPPTAADLALLSRSVASSQVDQLLGTNILAEETFGITDQNKYVGVSLQGDGAGITGTHRFNEGGPKEDYVLGVDLKNPQLQRGLADLEALDYLTGQIDRHCGNMFVDQNNKVTGIDNDLAFPERSLQDTKNSLSRAMKAKVVGEMPRQMHQDTARKILALDPDTLRQTLTNMPTPGNVGKLSDAAIQGACDRLVEMQNELKQPGGAIQVVNAFNDETYEAAMAAQEEVAQARLGVNIKDTPADRFTELCDLPKTSYLGAVAIQNKNYELNGKQIRPLQTAPQAPRNAVEAIYAKQLEVAKQAMTSNPAFVAHLGANAQQAQAITQELNALKDKVAHYEKEQAGLQKNKLGSLVRSLASGGTAKRQEFYGEKKFEAMQRIGELQKQLDTIAENALSNEVKADARAYAQEAVANHAAQNQPVVAQNNAVQNPPVAAQNNAVQNPPVAVQPNPALAGLVPKHPAPPPPGQFNHPPPSDMAPAVPNQDNLAQGNDQPKIAKARVAAKNKEGDLTVKAAEDELDVEDPDDLDENVAVEVEVKNEGLAKKPSVAEMLKRTASAPQLGGHKAAQGVDGEGPTPAKNTIRGSGKWQAAAPSGPKPGGGSLSASRQ